VPRVADRPAAVIGLDLGTTEAKAALVGLDGQLLGFGRAGYPTDIGPDGRAEQDPRAWWAAVAAAVRAAQPGSAEVLGICPVGQGPTLVAVRADGEPVRPALTWQDRRAGAGGYGLLPRIAWLAREDPSGTAAARWLVSAWDALGLWLTGEAAVSTQAHDAPITAEALEAAALRLPARDPARRSRGGAWTPRRNSGDRGRQ
jgi:sugar (pentulose or hexulose) kinase